MGERSGFGRDSVAGRRPGRSGSRPKGDRFPVAGSFQGFDLRWLADALRQLGPGYVGVANLSAGATDTEILTLDALGVRAVRFNLRRGGSEDLEALGEWQAAKVFSTNAL